MPTVEGAGDATVVVGVVGVVAVAPIPVVAR